MTQPNPEKPRLKGFYGKASVPVKVLDGVIIAGIVAILLVLALGMQNRGYTVRFDSLGGTPVESQEHMYGETLDTVEPPTREGYTFAGWYRDQSCQYLWNVEDPVQESMTLYAKWEEKS